MAERTVEDVRREIAEEGRISDKQGRHVVRRAEFTVPDLELLVAEIDRLRGALRVVDDALCMPFLDHASCGESAQKRIYTAKTTARAALGPAEGAAP